MGCGLDARRVALVAYPLRAAALITLAALFLRSSRGSATLPEIWSRPVCVPGIVKDCPNYVQGADPILRSNGDVDLLLNVGQLGDGSPQFPAGHWEGLFVLRFPASEQFPVRWYPIWASNDWGDNQARQELEAAYPTAVYWADKWRIAYSSTTSSIPWTSPNRDRVGRVDLSSELASKATPEIVSPWWLQPVRPECQPFGDNGGLCLGSGSGILPSFAVDAQNRLFLYHRDGSSDCPSRVLRHRVFDDMTHGEAACVVFQNTPDPASLQVSDVARGQDGLMYALANGPNLHEIREWKSDSSGLSFSLTGRTWSSPGTNGYPQTVWDGGYLKTESRRIVEPRVIVGNRSVEHWENAAYGDWHLVFWADPGAPLPVTFGREGSSCGFSGRPASCVDPLDPADFDGFQGNLDDVNCSKVAGWAWDPDNPSARLLVDILEGSTVIGQAPANRYRTDLENAGIGDGAHGFVMDAPPVLLDGNVHSVSFRVASTGDIGTGSPKAYACRPAVPDIRGHFEGVSCETISGWAWDASNPAQAVEVEVLVDGAVRSRSMASTFRGDLLNAGVGDGKHGFSIRAPDALRDGQGHFVSVRVAGYSTALPGSPMGSLCPVSGLGFYTLAPCRLLDTRGIAGPSGGPSLMALGSRTIAPLGRCGIPESARALAVNFTVIPAASGSLKAFPADLASEPSATVIAFTAGRVRANNGFLRVGEDASGSVRLTNTSNGTLDLIIDVVGFFR